MSGNLANELTGRKYDRGKVANAHGCITIKGVRRVLNYSLIMILFLAFFANSFDVFAQTSQEETQGQPRRGFELGINVGPFLVSGISGVREILPFAGVRYSMPFRKMHFEATGLSGRAEGTEYHLIDAGIRIDLAYDFISYFLLLGGDYHYWKRVPTEWQEFPYRSGNGWHTGFGFYYPISDVFSFRNDFKLNFGPGTSMYIGVGFVIHFDSEEDKADSQQQ
jgi:hypothetical protein